MSDTPISGYWYDYAAEEYIYCPPPNTDAEAKRLIPQSPAAQGLYEVRRLQGDGIIQAMHAVLTAYLAGIK